MSTQTHTYRNLERRGYIDGWERAPLFLRQVVKQIEELGELAAYVDAQSPSLSGFITDLRDLGVWAHDLFQRTELFLAGVTVDFDGAKSEIGDVFVPAAAMAHILGVDGMQEALSKSAADVERGVR